MKIYPFIASSCVLLVIKSCSSQVYISPQKLYDLLDNKKYSFTAQRANPSYQDSGMLVRVPNTRIYDLTSEIYGIDINDKEVSVFLPYFGRKFQASMKPDENSFIFTTKSFDYKYMPKDKKGYIITIKPNDISFVQSITIDIFDNGKAVVSVRANDRTPISYSGYIAEPRNK